MVARVEEMEELVCGVCEGPVKYRMATAKCAAKVVEVKRRRDRRHRRERLEGEGDGVGAESRIFEERNAKVSKQSDLENMFSDFFGEIVKEWNPCFTDTGACRYVWDAEIGAHDVELVTVDESEMTSEERALRDVEAKWPERMNLRALLDSVLGAGEGVDNEIDVQSLRRLVAALVHRVARHTHHGKLKPTLGKHACARGTDTCPVCRYGFPHECFPRQGSRRMRLLKGDREGQWRGYFPRNDELCCSYEEHILLANLGNVDWRPCLNLWAVVQYVTKYAMKAPKGTRRVHEVLKDAVDEVCRYVPEGEGTEFIAAFDPEVFFEDARGARFPRVRGDPAGHALALSDSLDARRIFEHLGGACFEVDDAHGPHGPRGSCALG